jgi:hypothetical protein
MPRPSGYRRGRPDSSGNRRNYPIFARSDRLSTEPAPKPEEYKELPRSDFADPFNAKYPVTQGHIHAALAYWARPEDRRFYTKEAQDRITRKIVEAALKDGVEVTYNPEFMNSLPEATKKRLKGYADPPASTVKALNAAIKDESMGQKEYTALATKVEKESPSAAATIREIRAQEGQHEKKVKKIKEGLT